MFCEQSDGGHGVIVFLMLKGGTVRLNNLDLQFYSVLAVKK